MQGFDYLLPERKQQYRWDSDSQDQDSPITFKISDKEKQHLKAIVEKVYHIPNRCSFAGPNQFHDENVMRQHHSCQAKTDHETKNREQRDGMNKG